MIINVLNLLLEFVRIDYLVIDSDNGSSASCNLELNCFSDSIINTVHNSDSCAIKLQLSLNHISAPGANDGFATANQLISNYLQYGTRLPGGGVSDSEFANIIGGLVSRSLQTPIVNTIH